MSAQPTPAEPWPIHPSSPGIAAALAKAQAEFLPIHRERLVTVTMKSGGKYTFAYAPLEVILRAVAPALAKHGIAMTQAVVEDCVETTLMHGSGQTLSNRVKIINQDGGAQAYGSALTYARRYGITLLLCVCADDDDDANASEGNTIEVKAKDAAKGDLGKNVPIDQARATATAMRGILELDVDHRVMALKVYDKHLILAKDDELYSAASGEMSAAERASWKALVKEAKELEKEDRAITNVGKRF
jgi:hypothetical protein